MVTLAVVVSMTYRCSGDVSRGNMVERDDGERGKGRLGGGGGGKHLSQIQYCGVLFFICSLFIF